MSSEASPLNELYSHIVPGESLIYEREEGNLIKDIEYEYAEVVEGFSYEDINELMIKEAKATLHPELVEKFGWRTLNWKAFYQEGNEVSLVLLGFKDLRKAPPITAVGSIYLSRHTPYRTELFGTGISVAGTLLDSNQTKRVVAAKYMGYGDFHNGNLNILDVSLLNNEVELIKPAKLTSIPLHSKDYYGRTAGFITPGMILDASPDESEHRFLIDSYDPCQAYDNLIITHPRDMLLTKFKVQKYNSNHIFSCLPQQGNPHNAWAISIPSRLIPS